MSFQTPVVLGIDEVYICAFEYDALVTAGPPRCDVEWFEHPNHFIETFKDTTDPDDERAPTLGQIRALIEWGAAQEGSMIVHCAAGISRSTACAWGIMIAKGVDAETALRALYKARPSEQYGPGERRAFQPNSLIVSYLQTIFDRRDLYAILYKVVGPPYI
jgi:predicted protein tyrosine phosphatase